ERDLDVLVLHLHGWLHAGGDRLGVLEAALDPRHVLEERVDEPFAETAHVGRAEAVDVRGERAAAVQPPQDLEDDRGLADATRPGEEDVVAVPEPFADAADVRLAPDEIFRGHGAADGEMGRGSGNSSERARHCQSIHEMHQSDTCDGYKRPTRVVTAFVGWDSSIDSSGGAPLKGRRGSSARPPTSIASSPRASSWPRCSIRRSRPSCSRTRSSRGTVTCYTPK